MYEELVNTNEYLQYIEHLGIDTSVIKESIQKKIKKSKEIFETFANRSHQISSPNINLENIIFEEVNIYIFQNHKNEFQFDISFKLDMESLVATKFSTIERPDIKKPSEIYGGLQVDIGEVGNFIRIARFENELILGQYGKNNSQQIVFEGLTPLKNKNPFFNYLPSSLIWQDRFHYPGEERIIGFYKKFNTIESKYVLWINSAILFDLGLELDSCSNGLRAIDGNNDVVLEFRCWRSELIGNGASFVGQDSNIAKLEGCDLLMRKDYMKKLQEIVGELFFVSNKI